MLLLGCQTISTDISSEYYNIGNAYFDVGNYEKAIEYFNKALEEKNPLQNKIRFNLAVAYSEADRVSEGLKHFEILLKDDPENIMILQSMAYSHFLIGNRSKSLEIYDHILTIFEYDTTALYNKSLIHLEDNDQDRAKKLLEKLYAVDPTIEVVLLLGDIYNDLGNDDLYIELLELAILEYQNNQELLVALVEYYEKVELYFKVLEHIDKLLLLDDFSNKPEYLFKKGTLEIVELSDFSTGFADIKKSIDEGFESRELVLAFLEQNELYQSEQLVEYFQEENLY